METQDQGRSVVITGCNKGIGYGIAEKLCQSTNKYKIVMACRSLERGEEAKKTLSKKYPQMSDRLILKDLDISQSASIDSFVAWVSTVIKKVDCLVNNAGIAFNGKTLNEEIVRTTFATNLYGTIELSEKMLPFISVGGRIVIVGSIIGKISRIKNKGTGDILRDPAITKQQLLEIATKYYEEVKNNTFTDKNWPRSAYAMSKVLINTFVGILSRYQDILSRDIQVFGCCPGWVRTDLTGPYAERSIEEGAACPTYLVELPEIGISPETHGKFFFDNKVVSFE
eukprot:TRINITY_DN3093_c0_g2_i1.p2 TRINITY_DN3093_c0_g2~~TRINITY_DN3093_c0_g2_i1.p2  ORF type:complete len:283 (-),score=34.02 TRINITY_DN3093_c0_g2_i1:161-1009(-)